MPMLSANCYAQGINERMRTKNRPCETFEIESSAQQVQFQNLKGVNINIEPTENKDGDCWQSLSSSICFIMPTLNYIKAMGFDDTGENEHTLTIELSRINVSFHYCDTSEDGASIEFQIKLTNREGKIIFEQVVETTVWIPVSNSSYSECLNKAYTQSLEKINWYKIASLLKESDPFLKESSAPKQQVKQKSKQVKGYGNTALENTIVRWDVQSRPAGADVFWRVVSKTPSVKSTNNKYLQTTPYEATKSLDIRGLSYENSGDVRVILRCEKEGYYPQEKEFNVRMILDQEEISAFFRLVKEE